MVMIQEVNSRYASKVADIIRCSFRAQAEILKLNESQYPQYVAFETAAKVITANQRGAQLVLAWDAGTAIGTVRYRIENSNVPQKGYISRLAVLPEYRGQRYGRQLMNYAESQLWAANVRTVEISIVAQFIKLQQYYEQMGYNPQQIQAVSSLPFAVLTMEKALSKS